MEKAIMKQKEPSGTTHAAFCYRFVIDRQTCAVRIFYRKQVKEIEQAYQHALHPIDPCNSIKLAGPLLVVINKIAVHE